MKKIVLAFLIVTSLTFGFLAGQATAAVTEGSDSINVASPGGGGIGGD
ncbi:lysogeny pheromone AimP family peptide [Cytobacillus purgationiresistens]|uniref:Uncharacterized protein n=1 Tax=Cytobacillus purgationiresistens TaxID=863449 RepID=A0ABU0AHP6_9BACI|nr:lysogeny pheromone AimP family peptide [Cytobacillus purgationiresistens]MDQ0270778.1 hypothetical protein [Cytobacillus purgationiresistens]